MCMRAINSPVLSVMLCLWETLLGIDNYFYLGNSDSEKFLIHISIFFWQVSGMSHMQINKMLSEIY